MFNILGDYALPVANDCIVARALNGTIDDCGFMCWETPQAKTPSDMTGCEKLVAQAFVSTRCKAES